MKIALGALGASFLLGLFLTPAGGYVARRLGILRRPEGESASERPTVPVVGGPVVLVIAGVVLAVLVGSGAVPDPAGRGVTDLVGGLAGAAVICLVGVVDDWRGLRGRFKLLGQVVA